MVEPGNGPSIDYKLCNGCGICYDKCPSDVFAWDEVRGQPIVAYPVECFHCAACDVGCPQEAIRLRLPVHSMMYLSIYPEI